MKQEKLLCVKDFPMNNGDIAFFQGKTYEIKDACFDEWEELTVKSEVFDDHIMPIDQEFPDYFELVEE